ncbi:MAG: chromate transporter [Defluviitaleaceae bacterium]|nr:chromate transporter [Defluviitaleaceae bacterium]
MLYKDIFMAFFRSGLLCFGGGPASIPFVHREAVERYKWMDNEEFVEIVAIGNTLPGPINTKMAGYIGYRVGGFFGLTIALIGATLPTAFLMIVLLRTLSHFSNEPWAMGMMRAMVPVVGVMLGIVGWQFLVIAAKGLGWVVTLAHVVVAAMLITFVVPHPAIVLAGLFLWALMGHGLLEKIVRSNKTKNEKPTEIAAQADDEPVPPTKEA